MVKDWLTRHPAASISAPLRYLVRFTAKGRWLRYLGRWGVLGVRGLDQREARMPTFFVRTIDGNTISQGEWQEVEAVTAEAAVQKVCEFPVVEATRRLNICAEARRQHGRYGAVLSVQQP
jgi:hypothetical protein